jgi:hypothetical protein
VPFAFYVGKAELPAGPCEVFPQNDGAFDLVIRNLNTGKAVVMPVISRIGTGEGGRNHAAYFAYPFGSELRVTDGGLRAGELRLDVREWQARLTQAPDAYNYSATWLADETRIRLR